MYIMRLRLSLLSWALVMAAMLAGGCSKEQPAAGVTRATNAAQTDVPGTVPAAPPSRGPGPMAAPARPVVVPDSGNVDATLAKLTLELRKYVIGTRSVPKNFEEFAAKSRVQAPAPPAGKKYAIQGQAIVLVNR
jgi:hypothetical protein